MENKVKVENLKVGKRYYSIELGHRYWYFVCTRRPQGYPFYGKETVYEFEDVVGHTSRFTKQQVEEKLKIA